ncbi:MAG: GntR family transcriptional regulator [Nocardioidaceae bacterium]
MSSQRFIEPLVQASTPSIIADKLRQAISHGELPAGMQLGEAELARQLGVSRGPLREGLQRLTQEGLLVAVRNRGVFVIEMTPENVRDMYLARGAVERAAAAQIFQHEPAAAAEKLLSVISDMSAAAESEDVSGVTDADIAFHELLVSLAQSPRLTRMHKTLLTETQMCIHALEQTYANVGIRVDEHRAIAEAFGAEDPALCDQLLVAHMDDAVERLSAANARVQATPSSLVD